MLNLLNKGAAKFIQVLPHLFLTTALSIFFSSLAISEEKIDNAELMERKVFIENATEQIDEEVKRTLAKAAKQGTHLHMVVSTLKPFGDWDFYYVADDTIEWSPNPGQKYKEVVVPVGFVTDLTSIPRVFWQALKPEGRYAYAAVVHDYLYWEQNRSREEADEILKFALEDSKVDSRLVEIIYLAVRYFGKTSWENNAKLKKSGERRFLKEFPEDFTISWSEWKKNPNVFSDNL